MNCLTRNLIHRVCWPMSKRYFNVWTLEFHVRVNQMILCLEIWNLRPKMSVGSISDLLIELKCRVFCGLWRILSQIQPDQRRIVNNWSVNWSLFTADSLLKSVFWSKIDWVWQSKLSGIVKSIQILSRLESKFSLQWFRLSMNNWMSFRVCGHLTYRLQIRYSEILLQTSFVSTC